MQSVNHTKLDQSTVNVRPDLGKAANAERGATVESPRLHPDQAAVEPRDTGVERAQLHPTQVPPPWPYAKTRQERIQAIEDFNGRISSISDSEYGDWMRRANMYWWHLVESLHGEEDANIRRTLEEIHRVIQYNPDFSILETSRKVIALSQKIERLLGGEASLEDMPVAMTGSGKQQAPDYSMMIENRKDADVAGALADGSNQGFIGKG